jgi:hypothetical protein
MSYTARRLWQDSNLRPSKEPSRITTGELVVHLIAGGWATRYRHFCPPRTELARPRSNRGLSPPANAYTRNSVNSLPFDPNDLLPAQESRADIGRGTSDNGTLGVLPFRPRGHKFPRQDSNLHLPRSRRSNRSLHHRPILTRFNNSPENRRVKPTRVAIYPGTLCFRTTPRHRNLIPAGPPLCASIRLVNYLPSFTTGETN